MADNTNDVKEQVLELLCGDAYPWSWGGPDGSCRFTFERDGTGTIACGENQHDWFALESRWLLTGEPVKVDNNTWKFTIQLTYTTRLDSVYHERSPWLAGAALQDHVQNPPPPSKAPFRWAPLFSAVFSPRRYTLTLSRGRFIEPFDYFIKKPYPLFQLGDHRSYFFAPHRYRSQLTFDVSPYPPREEWAYAWKYGNSPLQASLDYHRHWEKKRFVRDAIARKDETWAETLDLGWWLSPALGDSHKR